MAEKTGLERLTDQELINSVEAALQYLDWPTYGYLQEEIGRRVTAGTWTDPDPEEEEN